MRVLHLSSERTWRGGEQQIAYLIEESEKKGLENFVACRKDSAFSKYCNRFNIRHINLGFKNELDLFTAYKIKKYCQKNEIHLVHAHSSHSQAMAVLSAVLGNKTPVILSRKVDFPIKNNWFSHWKFNHKSIRHIICVSEAIKKIIAPDLQQKNHISVIHDGIAVERFTHTKGTNLLKKEYNIDSSTKIIANISAIAPHKDYFTFVDAAEIILQSKYKIHFFIVGDGLLRNQISTYIQTKNLEAHITLTGFRQDVSALFPDIDLFLMTSKTEGLGSTLLDAAANYVPIVSTNAGGIPEFVSHKETGLLANVGNAQELATQVLELIDNKELQEKLSQNAYQKLIHGFTKDVMVTKTMKIYEQIIHSKNS